MKSSTVKGTVCQNCCEGYRQKALMLVIDIAD